VFRSVQFSAETLPGSPPTWLTLRLLTSTLESQDLADKFHIQETSESIQCAPKQLTEQRRDAVVSELQAGSLPYLDVRAFFKDFPELFSTLEQAQNYLLHLTQIEAVESFVLSEVWMSKCVETCTTQLRHDGLVDLAVSVRFSQTIEFASGLTLWLYSA